MSDCIAEAKVRVLPDLSKFTTDLTQDLNEKIKTFNATKMAVSAPTRATTIMDMGDSV